MKCYFDKSTLKVCARGGGGLKRDQCLEKDSNEQLKCHFQNLLSSAGDSHVNTQLLTFSRYVRQSSLQGHHTHTPPSLLTLCEKWCEKLQVSLMCLFLSISVTGRPGLPFVHRRGEAGHAGPDQIQPRKSGSDPAPFGLITHPCRSHHPGLRH